MTNVSEWSVTAGSNNSSPPDGWPEGMARSAVNDAAREMMAALARWYKDANGSLVSAGGTTAYTLTTNNLYTALNDIPLLVFRINVANTGASTLSVDGLTAKTITSGGSALSGGDLGLNKLVAMSYNSNTDTFELMGPTPAAASTIPAGSLMLFQQTSAPSGWTKEVTHNNKALRLVSGTASSGGTTAFTSVLTSRTIATANLPSHTHSSGTLTGFTNTTGDHDHTYGNAGGTTTRDASGGTTVADGSTGSTSTEGDHSHGVTIDSGVTGSTGSGTAMDFAIQYVDVIIASKN